MLAQMRRQDQRSRSVVSLRDQMLRRLARNFAHIKMLAKDADQRGRDRSLILVDDREQDALAAIARLSGGGDDHDHHYGHEQQGDKAVKVAADEPEILQHHGNRLHDSTAPLATPYFRRIRESTSSTLILDSMSLSWLPRLAVRLTSSTVIAVAIQAAPSGRS